MTSEGGDPAEGGPPPKPTGTNTASGTASVVVGGDNRGTINSTVNTQVRQVRIFGSREPATVDEMADILAARVQKQWSKEATRLDVGGRHRLPVRWSPEEDGVCATTDDVRRWMTEHDRSLLRAGDKRWAASNADLAGTDLDLVDAWLHRAPTRRLVVLGEAGSGKSELLIRTITTFMPRREEFGAMVPVLIPVASWDSGDVETWLERRLVENYQFLRERAPGKHAGSYAQKLLGADKIAIVLDGFDELEVSRREAFVARLDAELEKHPRRAILLTSRPVEYTAAAIVNGRPGIGAAMGVRLLPQRAEAIIEHLEHGRLPVSRWAEVATAIRQGHWIGEVLQAPLMAMLAYTVYNSSSEDRPPPDRLVSYDGPKEVEQHLLDGYVEASYRDKRRWKLEDVKDWLGFLASTLNSRSNSTDLTWWNLRPEQAGGRGRPMWAYLAALVMIVVWTALSTATIYGWVFQDPYHGAICGARIAAAGAICYVTVLFVTRDFQAGLLAALGAYIAGSVTASFDLATAAAVAGGFAWRPLSVRHHRWWHCPTFGSLVATASALIQSSDPPFDSTPDKSSDPPWTEGFGTGFVDGWVTRGDEIVSGWLLSAILAGALLWAAIRSTMREDGTRPRAPSTERRFGPVGCGIAVGLLVVVVNVLANGAPPNVTHRWLFVLSDGFAIGLLVWWLVSWFSARHVRPGGRGIPAQRSGMPDPGSRRRRLRRAWLAALSLGLVALGLNGIGHGAQTDMTQPWSQAAAEGLGVAVVAWFVLHPDRGSSPRRPRAGPFGIWVTAIGAAAVAGWLDAESAGWTRGALTGLSIGLIVLYVRYTLARRSDSPGDSTRSLLARPLDAGMVAVMLVGIVTGFAFGLMVGMTFGLAVQVSRDVSQRHAPSWGPNLSWPGVIGGAVLGAVAAGAAGFSGIAVGRLVWIGLAVGAAAAVAFGTQGRVLPDEEVMTPRRLLQLDRRTFLAAVGVVAVTPGLAVSTLLMARGGSTQAGLLAAAQTIVTYGLTAGLLVAAAQSRYGAYTLWRLIYAARGRLPLRLMTFLTEMYDLRILRQNGVTYQFRHQFLQDRLENDG